MNKVDLFVARIKKGDMTLEQVPTLYKEEVQAKLDGDNNG